MSLKKATKTVLDTGVDFEFTNGSKLAPRLTDFSPEIRDYLACLGINHTVGDTYSGAETVEEAYEMAEEKIKSLMAGEKRSGSAGGPRATLYALAFSRIATARLGREVTEEEARGLIEDMDDDTKAKMRKDSRITKEIAKIKLERLEAADADNTPSILDSLFADAKAVAGGKGKAARA